MRTAFAGLLYWGILTMTIGAEGDETGLQKRVPAHNEELSLAPTTVAVQPIAQDEQIRKRIQSVMEATGWFSAPQVQVVDGVVFLGGRAGTEEIK